MTEEIEIDGRKYEIARQLAYQSKPGCEDMRCRRTGFVRNERTGKVFVGQCIGWHCPTCDEPTSSMGHDCPET